MAPKGRLHYLHLTRDPRSSSLHHVSQTRCVVELRSHQHRRKPAHIRGAVGGAPAFHLWGWLIAKGASWVSVFFLVWHSWNHLLVRLLQITDAWVHPQTPSRKAPGIGGPLSEHSWTQTILNVQPGLRLTPKVLFANSSCKGDDNSVKVAQRWTWPKEAKDGSGHREGASPSFPVSG